MIFCGCSDENEERENDSGMGLVFSKWSRFKRYIGL